MKDRSCGNCAFLLIPTSKSPCQKCNDESEWLPGEFEKLSRANALMMEALEKIESIYNDGFDAYDIAKEAIAKAKEEME